jgi:hypothetical protein
MMERIGATGREDLGTRDERVFSRNAFVHPIRR